MPFDLPFAGPYTQATYPVVLPYDISDPLPANWRLRITVGVPAQASLDLLAVCDGTLSAVPPDELPPSWFGLITIPSGQTPTAPIRLYLQPLRQPGGRLQAWSTRSGRRPGQRGALVRLRERRIQPPWPQPSPSRWRTIPGSPRSRLLVAPRRRRSAWKPSSTARPQLPLRAAPSSARQRRSPAPARRRAPRSASRPTPATSTRRPSSRQFNHPMAPILRPTLAEFLLLVPSQWPILRDAATADDVITRGELRLYPLPVLAEARTRRRTDHPVAERGRRPEAPLLGAVAQQQQRGLRRPAIQLQPGRHGQSVPTRSGGRVLHRLAVGLVRHRAAAAVHRPASGRLPQADDRHSPGEPGEEPTPPSTDHQLGTS